MANNRIVWNGMEELKRDLRNLPESLAGDASSIVMQAAEGAAAFIRAGYPEHTGNLKRGVIVSRLDQGKVAAGAVVKNTAKHAWIFENGTQARHTKIGANRGSMPPGRVFIPRVIKARRQMYEHLLSMLQQHGLTVSGTP